MAKKLAETIEPVDSTTGWVLVRALEALGGGDRFVSKGEEYLQPPEAAAFMAAQGWVEIVDAPAAVEEESEDSV